MMNHKRSRVRWQILGLLFLISVVTYIDRVNISVAGKEMMPAFGLSSVQMGTVFSAFVLGYALFQIPGGWLGDRWGPRRVLTLAVLWWSLFTVLTAEAGDLFFSASVGILGSLILIRFLIGVGEAAALPNFNRTVANWLAPSERGLGMGVSIGGIGLGSAATPPLVAWLMILHGWKTAFYVTGAIGLFVAAAWYLFSRDDPREHPRVNPSELAWITQTSAEAQPIVSSKQAFGELLKMPSVWFLTLSYTMLGYIAYIYLSWFFLYLVNVRHFTVLKGSFWAAGPFIAMAIFCPLGGWLSDGLTKRYGHRKGRTGVGGAGMLLTSLLIYSGAIAANPYTAIFLLSLGAGILYATVGAYWASTIDLSHKHSGALSGLMNMGANLGGTISPTLTPLIGERWGWPVALTVAAGLAFLGSLLWLGVKFDENSYYRERG
ncbi:MAG: MFS transporter [Nitrospirae bacterium]|nr:MFS transporter [Nitrospirota bacterium]